MRAHHPDCISALSVAAILMDGESLDPQFHESDFRKKLRVRS
jgi:hypothetical protein